MKYTSIQTQLRRFGGASLRAKIKKMNLRDRFFYLLKVAALENLNPVTARFLKSHFRNEIQALVLTSRRFGLIVMNDTEIMDFLVSKYKELVAKEKEKKA